MFQCATFGGVSISLLYSALFTSRILDLFFVMSFQPRKPKPRRRIRRTLRGVAFIALAIGIAGWLLWRNLTAVSLWGANRFLPAWRFEAERVAVGPSGGMMLKGVRVRLRRDGSEVISLDSARIEFTWQGLRERRLGEVSMDGLRVFADDIVLAEVRRMLPPKQSEGSAWSVGRMSVRGGFGRIALRGQPQIEGRIDAEILSLGTPASATGPDSVRFRGLVIRSERNRSIVTAQEIALDFTLPELAAAHLRSVTLNNARVLVTHEEAALLEGWLADRGPAKPWRIDELSISRTNIRFDWLAQPVVEGEISLQATDLGPRSGGGQAPGQFRVENLSVSPRDVRAKPATLASLTAQFTSSELLLGRLREVRVESPSVSLSDAWRSVRGDAANEAGADFPAGTSFPLRIDRLVVENGKADIAIGDGPLMRGLVAAEFRNLGSPDGTVQTVEFRDLHIGLPIQNEGSVHEWLTLRMVKVSFSLADLRDRHRLKSIEVDGASVRIDRKCSDLFSKAGNPGLPPTEAYVAEAVRIRNARVALDDLGLGIPPLGFELSLDLADVPLDDPLNGNTQAVQKVELANISFVSPLDPFVPVLAFHSVFIRWTPSGLRARQLEEVTIIGPVIYVCPDLFWYMDMVDKRRAAEATAGKDARPTRSWRIKRFEATSGELVLALSGQSSWTLPMPFESHAEDLDFNNLSDLRGGLSLEVPEQDYENHALDIHLTGVSGRVEFSLPPRTNADNVVHTLKVKDARWREFRGRNWWLALTFDRNGVYGNGGGRMCSGDISTGFAYFLDGHAPWIGWLSGARLDLKELTGKLSPGIASMTGRANVVLGLNGEGGEVTRVSGEIRSPDGGNLRITKLDGLLAAIPADWENAKRDLTRIGLETLRDFSYDSAGASFWMAGRDGQLNLRLDGDPGRRELEVNFNLRENPSRFLMFSSSKP